MAALGYPLVGEQLYARIYGAELQLWSVGVSDSDSK